VGTRTPTVALLIGTFAIAAGVLWLGRDGSLFHDDLWFLCGRSLADVGSWFRPHNEHWVTFHVLAYMGIVALFGANYLPLHVGLVVTLVAAAWGLYALVTQRIDRLAGVVAGAILLTFGSASVVFFWAFEIGFVGAMALGLWALAALRDQPRLALVLLLVGVATGGSALPFVAAAIVLVTIDRGWRAAPPFLLPAFAYGAYVLLEVHGTRGTFSLGGAPGYLASAVVAGLGAVVGVGVPGILGSAVALALAGPRRPSPLFWAGSAGLLVTTGILAATRQNYAPPSLPQYLYAMAPFIVMAGADLFGRAHRRLFAVPVIILALVVNGARLVDAGVGWSAYIAHSVARGANEIPPGVCYPITR
jgi:hypothetical protein